MHPDIGDLIVGIKRSLVEEILPAVSTAYAREQLAFAALFCDHIAARWDRAHLFVMAEFDDLRATLAAAVAQGRRCRSAGAPLLAALDAADDVLATGTVAAQPLRILQATAAELKARIVRLLDAVEADHGDDSAALAEIRGTLHSYMRRQLAREEEWVSTTPIGWW